jgi:hypothetical protein
MEKRVKYGQGQMDMNQHKPLAARNGKAALLAGKKENPAGAGLIGKSLCIQPRPFNTVCEISGKDKTKVKRRLVFFKKKAQIVFRLNIKKADAEPFLDLILFTAAPDGNALKILYGKAFCQTVSTAAFSGVRG